MYLSANKGGMFMKNDKKIRQKIVSTVIFSLLLVLSPLNISASQHEGTSSDNAEELPTTGFEDRGGDGWTTLAEELASVEARAERSDRGSLTAESTVVEGRTID